MKNKKGECVYCGKIENLETEHVIPQCLFTKPRPGNMITVPVCKDCNGHKSSNDDYLRDFLVTDYRTSEHPVAKQLFLGKALRSDRRNRSTLLKFARREGQPVEIVTKSGIYIENGFSAPLDGERICNILADITKGLYFFFFHKRLPSNYAFDIIEFTQSDFELIQDEFKKLKFSEQYSCGEVFDCRGLKVQEDEFISVWLIWFYKKICFRIITKPLDFDWGL